MEAEEGSWAMEDAGGRGSNHRASRPQAGGWGVQRGRKLLFRGSFVKGCPSEPEWLAQGRQSCFSAPRVIKKK